jgi:predicted nucleic acid-binding protein
MGKNKLILPDTCAWIDYFRPGGGPLAADLRRELADSTVCACGIVLMELLQGVRGEKERNALATAFEALPWLEADRRVWTRAGELAGKLRAKGVSLPFSDIVIAALALDRGATVLTRDAHFVGIDGLEVVGLE